MPDARPAWTRGAAVVALHLLVAVVLTWPLVLDPGGQVVGGARSDVWNSLWGLWFVAGEGGLLPAATGLLDHPAGGRIAVADPLNAALAWPITAAAGPVVALAALTLFHSTLGGVAAHALGRATGGRGWIAGLGYQLAPICLAHLQNGSSEAASIGWLPLAALAVVKAARDGGWGWRLGAGALLGACAVGGWYAGVGAWLVVAAVLLLGPWGTARERALRLAPGLMLALAITLPVAAQVRAVAVADDGLVDIKNEGDLARIRRTLGGVDPRSFVAPGDFRSPDFAALEGNPSDFLHTTYLGFGLLGLAVVATVRRREDAAVWWAAAGGAAVLALGPVVVWDGRPLALGARELAVPLPYLALEPLPGFGSLSLLWRLATTAALGLAVLADRLRGGWALLVVGEVVLVSPVRGLPEVTPIPDTAPLVEVAAEPGAVLNLPPTAARSYLYEQTVHGQPLTGSLNTGTNVAGLAVLRAARVVRAGEQAPSHLGDVAREHGVRWVVQHRDVLMDEAVLVAAGALREHGEVVAESDRLRVIRLY